MALIEISERSHGLRIDLRYAGSDNFTGRPVYARAACYLRDAAEEKLRVARDLARIQGWGLLIFDAFRPSEAQWKLWRHTPDPVFLADPNTGSPHSRGVAVDLTLTDLETGAPLDMGTDFDAFTALAHHANTDVSADVQDNRYRLLGLMTAAGWDCYLKEWWHYQLFDSKSYRLLSDADAGTAMMG